MKLITKQYELYCHNNEYDNLVRALNEMSISTQKSKDFDGWIYFVMPEGKIKIKLRDERSLKGSNLEGKVSMQVIRTTRKEPKYINKIVKRLKGSETPASKVYTPFTPEEIIEMRLGRDSHEQYKTAILPGILGS